MKLLITSLIIAAGITSSAFAQQGPQEDNTPKYGFYRFHAIHGGSDGFTDPGEQQKEHEGTPQASREVATYFQVQLTNPSINGVMVYVCSLENGCSRLGAGTYPVA
jgi:hypothetical protein